MTALALLLVTAAAERPNVLWLTFEDTSAYEFAAYGNPQARTPNFDRLAEEGILFENASSVAPHCSPARATLISGTHATTYGTDLHRKAWPVPEDRYYFPRLLREAGYFTSNNAKTDYNAAGWNRVKDDVWSEQGKSATYNSDARGGRPFFSVFNSAISHMGRIRSFHLDGRRDFGHLDPEGLELPPYVPDCAETRSDYAFHLEGVEDIDRWIGKCLTDLEESGLAEDTVVFVFGDHGGCLPRGKGYPFASGLRVPLAVRVPEKWRGRCRFDAGSRTADLVGFEDFAATVLTLCGIEPPGHMSGRDFLSRVATPKPVQFAFRTNHGVHFDPLRIAFDGRYRYVRCYTPHVPMGLWQGYQWGCPGHLAWTRLHVEETLPNEHAWFFREKPREYLFDEAADPWDRTNLADDPDHAEALSRLSAAVDEHMKSTRDLGLFPPSTRKTGGEPFVAAVGDDRVARVRTAADAARRAEAGDVASLEGLDADADPAVRFWGVSGLATLARRGAFVASLDAYRPLTSDDCPEVRAEASALLAYSGYPNAAAPLFAAEVADGNSLALSRLLAAAPFLATERETLEPLSTTSPQVPLSFGWRPFGEFVDANRAAGRKINADRRDWRRPLP